ncbi:hypothetical protein HPB48_013922 [Haemaphysalis longicornis]|uniref:Uncharacterized protein n=1 Tax=Haemaphysalis longicornis TaxID=44386 RepID=A0A9J6GT98_HAELO|nr:hypothetical protein HPB48_013922 [Haemaphysalis longicornis]
MVAPTASIRECRGFFVQGAKNRPCTNCYSDCLPDPISVRSVSAAADLFLCGPVFSISGAHRYLRKTPSTPRSSQGFLANMKLALREQFHVNGLKCPSPVVNLPGYGLVRGQAVE